ncbi:hypothetical protein T484DRAFT_1766599 [Baffinella frigidus]|nr:hypothetical protein T484DRAFT_1766599 [Cryptophyta sp. CCMP2293]
MSLRWTWKLVLAAAALGAATAAANRPPVEELPSGWKAVEDKAGGGTYFWNQKSGEVTWDRPFHLDFADLDDVDDLLTGTGIERYDLRVMGVDGASAYLPDISETGFPEY